MDKITLYRGITLSDDELESAVNQIKLFGLDSLKGFWKFSVPANISEVQENVSQLLSEPTGWNNLWAGKLAPGFCACGDYDSAAYYAAHKNVDKQSGKIVPVVIKFEASLSDLYIDGRDFLIPALQAFDKYEGVSVSNQSAALEEIFGASIGLYFNQCVGVADVQERVRIANVACFDRRVIRQHLVNKYRLGGRHQTIFRSAFFVSAPISPSNILAVDVRIDSPGKNYHFGLESHYLNGVPISLAPMMTLR